jgi:hypothetical protein
MMSFTAIADQLFRRIYMPYRDRSVRGLLNALAEKNDEIEALEAQLREKDIVINAITSSTSWRLLGPVRGAVTFIGRLVRGLRLLITRPKQFFATLLRVGASVARGNPQLRKMMHAIFDRLPEALRRRLIAMAPPSPEEANLLGGAASPLRPQLIGDGHWIYRRLAGRG